MEPLMTIFTAAERLALKPATIRKWIFQKRLSVVRLGRSVRIKASDIEALIRKGTRPAIEETVVPANQNKATR